MTSDMLHALQTAASRGDLMALRDSFTQPEMLAHVQAVDAQIPEDVVPMQGEVYCTDAWYTIPGSYELLFDRIIDRQQDHILEWFFTSSPPCTLLVSQATAVPWCLRKTLVYLLDYVAVGTVLQNQVMMLEILLNSTVFQHELSAASQHELLTRLMVLAASSQHAILVHVLIAHGADVNGTHHVDWEPSPLVSAVRESPAAGVMAQLLIHQGADVLGDRWALFYAAGEGKVDAVDTLLRHGADPRLRGRDDAWPYGFSALHSAAKEGHHDVIELLLTKGYADVDVRDRLGASPMLVAAREAWGFEATAEASQTQVVEVLLRHGANIHLRDDRGMTALLSATAMTNVGVMQLLLMRGADPNAPMSDGISPLYFLATFRGRSHHTLQALRVLVRYGGDLSKPVLTRGTPYQRLMQDEIGRKWAKRLIRKVS